MIHLVDARRLVQAAVSSGERAIFAREDAMCDAVVRTDTELHISDMTADHRFARNPFVDGTKAALRMYFGVPVHDCAGLVMGTLCVTDPSPRELSAAQRGSLRDLAAQVERLFEMRRQHHQLVDVLAEVDHYASHDPLTGAANRRTLVDRLDLALGRSCRSRTPPTVIFCDLDGFKAVNDVHGHAAGDAVLVEVARRLAAVMRPSDTVARLGGDEFVLLCEDLPPRHRRSVADRVRSAVAAPITLPSGLRVLVGVSLGVVDATALDAVSALRAADELMYVDKRSRRMA